MKNQIVNIINEQYIGSDKVSKSKDVTLTEREDGDTIVWNETIQRYEHSFNVKSITQEESISSNSISFKGGFPVKIDSAVGDISVTSSSFIENLLYLDVLAGNVSAKFDSTIQRTGRLTLQLSTTNSTGSAVVKLRPMTGASPTLTNERYLIRLNASTKYRMGCWVKTNNVATDAVFLQLLEHSATLGTALAVNTTGKLIGTNDWTYLYVDFTTNASTVYGEIYFNNSVAGNVGSANFDINSFTLSQIIESTTNTLINKSESITSVKGVSTIDNIDQSQLTSSTQRAVGNLTQQKIAQQFTPTKSKFTGVSLRRNNNGGTFTGNVYVSIQSNSADSPTGTILASYTIPNATFNSFSTSTPFYVDLPCDLVADGTTKYWIVIETSTIDASNYATIRGTSNVYTGGLYKEYNGSVWTAQSIDLYFTTFYNKNTTSFNISEHNQYLNLNTNQDGIFNGAVIDLLNNKYSFEIKPTTEVIANQYANIVYNSTAGGVTANDKIKINGWKWQDSLGGEFISSSDSSERYITIKVNTICPINHLKITSKFGYEGTTTELRISTDGINFSTIGTHSGVQTTAIETDLVNMQSTFYLQFYKGTSVNNYFSVSNLKIEADIDTMLPILYNYPTATDISRASLKALSSAATRIYLRLTKYGFPALEYTDGTGKYIDYEYLPIDITGAINSSETIYLKIAEGNATPTIKYSDGEYITISSTIMPVIKLVARISTNRIFISSNDNNGLYTKDGSEQGTITYMSKVQGLIADVKDLQNQMQEVFENIGRGYWKDIDIAGTNVQAGASAPGLIGIGGGNIQIRAFDGVSTAEELSFSFEIPHGRVVGTDIFPHIHWLPTTTGTGNVKWNIDWIWISEGDVAGTGTSSSVISPTSGTAWKMQTNGFGRIVGAGKKIGSQLLFRLYRNPADASDTYGADAGMLTFGVHVLKDKLGSIEIFNN